MADRDWKFWFNAATAFLLGGGLVVLVAFLTSPSIAASAGQQMWMPNWWLFILSVCLISVAAFMYGIAFSHTRPTAETGERQPLIAGTTMKFTFVPKMNGKLFDHEPTLVRVELKPSWSRSTVDLKSRAIWDRSGHMWVVQTPPDIASPSRRGKHAAMCWEFRSPDGQQAYVERPLVVTISDGANNNG